jgi:hypothetical protein
MTIRWSDGTKSEPDKNNCPTVDPPSLLVRCFTARPATIGEVNVTAVFLGVVGVSASVDSKTITIIEPPAAPGTVPVPKV